LPSGPIASRPPKLPEAGPWPQHLGGSGGLPYHASAMKMSLTSVSAAPPSHRARITASVASVCAGLVPAGVSGAALL
jgi:hypothetical protein